MAALADIARRFDPAGIMNPGVLLATSRDRIDRRDTSSPSTSGTQSVRALVFDPRGTLVAARADPDRAVRLAPARLGGAGRGALLALDRRGVRGALGRRPR